eukprot:GGOE01003984.1.p1 GENE.GGOE01003984.1~~GGOE01003984.1.p1  ORF type:complete len:255 (-),score=52.79 GGOE01003984.1:446-1108(-)
MEDDAHWSLPPVFASTPHGISCGNCSALIMASNMEDAIQSLLAMGFDHSAAQQAVSLTNPAAGDVLEQAVNYIVAMQEFCAAPVAVTHAMSSNVARCTDSPCKLMLVVRQDLQMGIGKIAAQCSHATLGAWQQVSALPPEHEQRQWLRTWEDGAAKIVVRCDTEAEMDELLAKAEALRLPHYVVHDAGRTQVAPNSRTVLAVGPAPGPLVDEVTGHLKLL